MTENLFKKAVENNESADFFLGNGCYFARNRESHNHSYVTHITGWVREFIEENPRENLNTFLCELSAFFKYIAETRDTMEASLSILFGTSTSIHKKYYSISDVNEDDTETLYKNLSSYFRSYPKTSKDIRLMNLYADRIESLGDARIAEMIRSGFDNENT